MHPHMSRRTVQRGIVSVLAMMFLVIFSSLAAAMAIVAQGNLRTAESYRHVNRSLVAAETGMNYFTWQAAEVANTITTPEGEIDENLADEIWEVLYDALLQDIGDDGHYLAAHDTTDPEVLRLAPIALENHDNSPTYQITLMRHDIVGEDYNAPRYQQPPYNVGGGENRFTADGEPVSQANPISGVWVRIRSVGRDGDYVRSLEIDFRLDKKIRYAILSRNRVMIGRNVMISGSIGSRYTHTDYEHGHPVQMLDDFRGLDSELDGRLDELTDHLAATDADHDNRIRLADHRETDGLPESFKDENGNYIDHNDDGYIDAYDLFLDQYGDGDGGIPIENFTDSGGDLVDRELWRLINEFKYPPGTEFDWSRQYVRRPGEGWKDASDDLSYIDGNDMYAKIDGEMVLASSKEAWEDGAAMGRYQDYFQGPIHPEKDEAAVTFEADADSLDGLTVDDFDMQQYRDMATNDFQQAVDSGSGVYTPPGSGTRESVPFEAAHPYDHYDRPVYEGYTFENVTIPKGTNALFVNCTFKGVTFVETNENNDDPRFNIAGTQDEDGSLLYEGLAVDVDGNLLTDTKAEANNLRFHDSKFEGIVVADPPKQFAHVRNKLQFTGGTGFDLSADAVGENRELFQRSTLLAPHYSVEMGTFVDPSSASNQIQLDGMIVAGVFDIRGQAVIDGSIITTFEPEPGEGPLTYGGSPAASNTTIGYFGAEDGDSEAELPDGGSGKIIIRYDPSRAMPDGISGPIELRPDMATYVEGAEAS